MKGIVFVLFLLILLFLCCVFSFQYIDRTSAKLDQELTGIQRMIKSEQWDEAASALDSFRIHWEKISRRWKVLIDHDDIRDIEISITELITAVKQNDLDEAEKEMESLRYFLKHVPENEKIAFYNIL